MTTERRLVLVGAGHTHLHVLRHAGRLRALGYRITLIAPRWFDYSGTATAFAAGGPIARRGRIDVAALCERLLVHHRGTAAAVDLEVQTVTTTDAHQFAWDTISFNVGSVTSAPTGVEVAHGVIGVKPLNDLDRLRTSLPTPRVVIIGGGISGIEVAAQLSARGDTAVDLLESGSRVGSSLPPAASRRVVRLLEQRGVRVLTGVDLTRIDADRVHLRGDQVIEGMVVLASGLTPPEIASRAPLGSPDGIPVGETLQHAAHDRIFAAGDCADFLPHRLPRLGVHGVRQGPVLLGALEAQLTGSSLPTYDPPEHTLSILDLGSGIGLAVRGRWWWLGRLGHFSKEVIDHRWLRGYRR